MFTSVALLVKFKCEFNTQSDICLKNYVHNDCRKIPKVNIELPHVYTHMCVYTPEHVYLHIQI